MKLNNKIAELESRIKELENKLEITQYLRNEEIKTFSKMLERMEKGDFSINGKKIEKATAICGVLSKRYTY